MISDTRRQPRALQHAAGDFIAGYAPWTYYATLTFKNYVGSWQAQSALKTWSRQLAREHVRTHVKLAYAMEQTKGAGIWHYHLLFDAPVEYETDVPVGVFDREIADLQWKAASPMGGFTRFEKFEPSGAAPYYLTKTASYDVGMVCPRILSRCRRGGGCPEDPEPW